MRRSVLHALLAEANDHSNVLRTLHLGVAGGIATLLWWVRREYLRLHDDYEQQQTKMLQAVRELEARQHSIQWQLVNAVRDHSLAIDRMTKAFTNELASLQSAIDIQNGQGHIIYYVRNIETQTTDDVTWRRDVEQHTKSLQQHLCIASASDMAGITAVAAGVAATPGAEAHHVGLGEAQTFLGNGTVWHAPAPADGTELAVGADAAANEEVPSNVLSDAEEEQLYTIQHVQTANTCGGESAVLAAGAPHGNLKTGHSYATPTSDGAQRHPPSRRCSGPELQFTPSSNRKHAPMRRASPAPSSYYAKYIRATSSTPNHVPAVVNVELWTRRHVRMRRSRPSTSAWWPSRS